MNGIKDKKIKVLVAVWAIYAASVIVQNVLAAKSIDVWKFTVTTGIIVSPFVFVVNDVSTEIFGYKVTKRMILWAFLLNFSAVVLYQLAIIIPPSVVYTNNEAFKAIFQTTLRISTASFIAYMIGSLLNTWVFAKFRAKYEKSLFVRCVTSTFVGQVLDNAIFAFGAFFGVMPLENILSMVLGATIIEVMYEVVLYPVVKAIIKSLNIYIEA